ncbi:MAG: hypothetical protein E7402_02050 [Ruminococcaceae bacterium]|nr:hypothetical protein [Oscillospiraceae bacterium]
MCHNHCTPTVDNCGLRNAVREAKQAAQRACEAAKAAECAAARACQAAKEAACAAETAQKAAACAEAAAQKAECLVEDYLATRGRGCCCDTL